MRAVKAMVMVFAGGLVVHGEANAYYINWLKSEMVDLSQEINAVRRSSTNVAWDTLFVDAFPTASLTLDGVGEAQASVSSVADTEGVVIHADTDVSWSTTATWSGVWANANANYDGVFSVESETGQTGSLLLDVVVRLSGEYDSNNGPNLSLGGQSQALDPALPVQTFSFLAEIGQTYAMTAYLYSWVVGAVPGGVAQGSASAHGVMDIGFLFPREGVIMATSSSLAFLALACLLSAVWRRRRQWLSVSQGIR